MGVGWLVQGSKDLPSSSVVMVRSSRPAVPEFWPRGLNEMGKRTIRLVTGVLSGTDLRFGAVDDLHPRKKHPIIAKIALSEMSIE